MEQFRNFIKEGTGSVPGDELAKILRAYPWFATARMVKAMQRSGKTFEDTGDPLLETYLTTTPVPRWRLQEVDYAPAKNVAMPAGGQSEENIIDNFLSRGEYRIVPRENTPEDEMAAGAEPSAEVPATEELAKIYLKQQLWAQAREAYEKLSLVYPEKSVYFAEILAHIDARSKSENN